MAGLAVGRPSHRHTGSISGMETGGLLSTAPRIEMMPNPDFSFPALPAPRSPSLQPPTPHTGRRPVSVHSNASPNVSIPLAHRRHKSAHAQPLPSFSFNAEDTTGRIETSTPPLTPDEALPETPVGRKLGHKRGGSEFVGGVGVEGAISSSPTKTTAFPLPLPQPGRRGHSHKRSGALGSSNDLHTIVRPPAQAEARTSISLPPTPLHHGSQAPPPLERAASSPDVLTDPADPFGPPLDDEEARPAFRPRVEFSEQLEFIPRSRPLSTISSETESSMSTVRGHIPTGSISSVLSINLPSPPSSRRPRTSLSTTLEDEDRPRARSSVEVSRRIEKEGEWLKSRSSQSLKRPVSDSAAGSSISFAAPPELPAKPRNVHHKKHSLSHALGLDRRRSEPSISLKSADSSRLSAVSLQDQLERANGAEHTSSAPPLERRSSSKRIRDWAVTKITKRPKEARSASNETVHSVPRPRSAGEMSVPGRVPVLEAPAAETDLDAVFSSRSDAISLGTQNTVPRQQSDMSAPIPSYVANNQVDETDEGSAMVDLDAALGPLKTPAFASHKQRKELHSSRGTRDFVGPGLHYHPGVHRRAESAPELAPFVRSSMQAQSLPDVFEGEGEEEAEGVDSQRPASSGSDYGEASSVGIHVVDAAEPAAPIPWANSDGLRIMSSDWEMDRPNTSYGSSSQLSTPSNERRPSSIIEQTIIEESSPIEPIEIVEAHEEPRASSLTKSSDSSETPTLLASQSGTLALPDGSQSLMTPDTFQTSTFSSPDFSRRQGSFDTSRVGTAASSITDNRTMSSCTGDHNVRMSVDDVPSLTSSRSTMMSTMHANSSHRDFGVESVAPATAAMDPALAADRRRKRASIQSLSQLVGGSFSGKSKSTDALRPQTAVDLETPKAPKRKEHRLKKLMFWRSKSKQSLHSVP